MSKVIAITNHKGGVGKTTTTASLGVALARKGNKVLLIDLDAQMNLTSMFLNDDELLDVEDTMYEALTYGEPIPHKWIRKNLALAVSSLDLAAAEAGLNGLKLSEAKLRASLEPVKGKYDYILIDCPPSLGLLTVNALFAADEVLIPLTAEALQLRGVEKLEQAINAVAKANRSLKICGILITRYNNRKLNKQVVEAIQQRYGRKLFKTKIRENIAVAEAPNFCTDIFDYDSNSNGAKDYAALAQELISRDEKAEL